MHSDTMLASMAIGAAAALAGMIWPFRRGPTGIFINFLAGIAGALIAAMVSFMVLPSGRQGEAPVRLIFAALGALASLGVVHALLPAKRAVGR